MVIVFDMAIELIERVGWEWERTTGSHRHYEHPTKKGIVTVSGKLSDDIPIDTELSILNKQD